jgi:hypothetical protein
MTKHEILTQALEARQQEIMGYQINIDNYTLAIAHIQESGDTDLTEFREKLEASLVTEKLEQKKAMVIGFVIQQQLETL